MVDLAALSAQAHTPFEVAVTVIREVDSALVEFDTKCVFHLDGDYIGFGAGQLVASRSDRVSFRRALFTPMRGDLILCNDPRAVLAESAWEITSRQAELDDGFISTWAIRKADYEPLHDYSKLLALGPSDLWTFRLSELESFGQLLFDDTAGTIPVDDRIGRATNLVDSGPDLFQATATNRPAYLGDDGASMIVPNRRLTTGAPDNGHQSIQVELSILVRTRSHLAVPIATYQGSGKGWWVIFRADGRVDFNMSSLASQVNFINGAMIFGEFVFWHFSWSLDRVRIFRNGMGVMDVANTLSPGDVDSAAQNFTIGAQPAGGNVLDGEVKWAARWPRALTPAEVYALRDVA
jgi:hypothetical protein